jgi:hypothetical protein
LNDLIVLDAPQVQFGRIRNRRLEGKCRAFKELVKFSLLVKKVLTQRAGSIKALRKGPLGLVKLLSTARHVVGSSVSEDIV